MASKKAAARRPTVKPIIAFELRDAVRFDKSIIGTIRSIADHDDGSREYQVRFRDKGGTVEHRWMRADKMTHA